MIRLLRGARFLVYYTRLFLWANVIVAWEIVTPGSGITPAIVSLPLRARTPAEITVLAHLITLTPGTIVIEAGDDPPALLVHGMHAGTVEDFRSRLRDLETRLLAVLRTHGGDAA
ncbi:Na+/H+ antiporter subunit E [Microbispora rosea]|uniref:Na+/H+ antiporter subunit E n=1 Tax=Microbispora rosea TaxID=58117 RepID=UPI0034338384